MDVAAEDDPAATVVGAICTLLEGAMALNDEAAWLGAVPAASGSAFRGRRRPGMSVRAYMERIVRFADCSPACFVAAFIYLDRHRLLQLAVDSYTVHRLVLTAVLAAVKFLDGRSCLSNAYFARVGGISLQEMNRLELDFLFRVGFDLNVPPETFAQYCAMLRLEMLCLEPPLTLPAATAPEDDGSSSSQQRAA